MIKLFGDDEVIVRVVLKFTNKKQSELYLSSREFFLLMDMCQTKMLHEGLLNFGDGGQVQQKLSVFVPHGEDVREFDMSFSSANKFDLENAIVSTQMVRGNISLATKLYRYEEL